MAKDLRISLLYDFYGQLLTEKQQEAIELYYNEDLSLAEIAQFDAITRQGVRDSIKRAEAQLLEFEERLGLLAKFCQVKENLAKIEKCALAIKEINDRLNNSMEIDSKCMEIKNLCLKIEDQ